MPFRPYENQNCSIARTLALVGERWTLLVVREVLLGRYRFEEIRRQTGVAPNILADRLQTLVAHGVLERHPSGVAGDASDADRGQGEREREREGDREGRHRGERDAEPHEYRPTQRALDLAPVLVALTRWGDRHLAGEDGPPRIFVHTACGHDADPTVRCGHCDQAIDPRELKVRPGPGATAHQRTEGILPAA